MIASLVLSLAMAGYSIYQGINQQNEAKKIADTVPMTGIPHEYDVAKAEAANLSKSDSPGYRQFKSDVAKNEATAVSRSERAAHDSSQLLGAISAADTRGENALLKAEAYNDRYKDSNKRMYISTLLNIASSKSRIEEANKIRKWNVETAEKNAGQAQINQGVNDAVSAAAMYSANKSDAKDYKQDPDSVDYGAGDTKAGGEESSAGPVTVTGDGSAALAGERLAVASPKPMTVDDLKSASDDEDYLNNLAGTV